jgi:hypothetical protein
MRVLFVWKHDGVYWSGVESEVRHVKFLKKRLDGSFDVYCGNIPIQLSGKPNSYYMHFLNLKPDGTVRYYTPKREITKNMAIRYAFNNTVEKHPQDWKRNIPNWRLVKPPCFYQEARLGALWCILCLTRMKIFPKDVIKIIAKIVYASHHEWCWVPSVSREGGEEEPQTKRIKI